MFLLGLCFSIFFCCATIDKEVAEGNFVAERSVFFEGYSFDKVWDSALLALVEIRYMVISSDKKGGVIVSENKAGRADMTVLVMDKENGVSVIVQASVGILDLAILRTHKKDIRLFMDSLNEKLQSTEK